MNDLFEHQERYERALRELANLESVAAKRGGPLPGLIEDRLAAKRREVERLRQEAGR